MRDQLAAAVALRDSLTAPGSAAVRDASWFPPPPSHARVQPPMLDPRSQGGVLGVRVPHSHRIRSGFLICLRSLTEAHVHLRVHFHVRVHLHLHSQLLHPPCAPITYTRTRQSQPADADRDVLLSPHAAPSGRPGAPPQAKDAPLLPEDPLSLVVAHLTARGVQRREHGPTWAQRVKQRVSAIRDSVRCLTAALALVDPS
jgi:hypothetical protein